MGRQKSQKTQDRSYHQVEAKLSVSCGHRVPITLRDLFWQDPFFSSNWEDFHKIHEEMMSETRAVWNKFDEQLKLVEAKSPLPLSDIKAPGWVFPQKRAHFMHLPSIFNE